MRRLHASLPMVLAICAAGIAGFVARAPVAKAGTTHGYACPMPAVASFDDLLQPRLRPRWWTAPLDWLLGLERSAVHVGHIPLWCSDLELQGAGLGDQGVRSLVAALDASKNVTTLRLQLNGIGFVGVQALSTILQRVQSPLTALFLAGNNIGSKGAVVLAAALAGNTVLTLLQLSSNHIGNTGAYALAIALEDRDIGIRYLDLANNSIDDDGALALAAALEAMPKPWITLDLQGNLLSDVGVDAVAPFMPQLPTAKQTPKAQTQKNRDAKESKKATTMKKAMSTKRNDDSVQGAEKGMKNHRPCGRDEYEVTPATSHRRCAPLTVCDAIEFELTKPTATSNRVCQALTEDNFILCDFLQTMELEALCDSLLWLGVTTVLELPLLDERHLIALGLSLEEIDLLIDAVVDFDEAEGDIMLRETFLTIELKTLFKHYRIGEEMQAVVAAVGITQTYQLAAKFSDMDTRIDLLTEFGLGDYRFVYRKISRVATLVKDLMLQEGVYSGLTREAKAAYLDETLDMMQATELADIFMEKLGMLDGWESITEELFAAGPCMSALEYAEEE